jgi:hypothetical protein
MASRRIMNHAERPRRRPELRLALALRDPTDASSPFRSPGPSASRAPSYLIGCTMRWRHAARSGRLACLSNRSRPDRCVLGVDTSRSRPGPAPPCAVQSAFAVRNCVLTLPIDPSAGTPNSWPIPRATAGRSPGHPGRLRRARRPAVLGPSGVTPDRAAGEADFAAEGHDYWLRMGMDLG